MLSLPVCRVRALVCVPCVFVCVEVWHILFVLISLYSVFYVWYAHYYIRHYKDSILLSCTHIVGRFFAREYLYIT